MLLAVDDIAQRPLPSRIFVIEDDPDHQKIAELTLRAAGVDEIKFFGTGEEAMDYFLGVAPSGEASSIVIFIDLMLPKIGGLEILRKLKSDNRWKDSRMVVLTCSTDSNDRICAQEYGADDFLTKPLCSAYVKRIFSAQRN
jgi:two-component system response regulator